MDKLAQNTRSRWHSIQCGGTDCRISALHSRPEWDRGPAPQPNARL